MARDRRITRGRQADRRARRERARAHLARRRSEGRAPEPRHRGWTVALGLAATLVGFLVAAGGLDPFGVRPGGALVRAIAVQGVERLSAAEVAAASGVERGEPLDHVDREAVARRLETHPWIAEARTATLPDGTLVVRVVERRPAAVAVAEESGSLHWVDAGGLAFAEASAAEVDASAWPRIAGVRAEEIAGPAPAPRLAQAVALVSLAAERGIPAPIRLVLPGEASGGPGWILAPDALGLEAWLGDEPSRFPERIGRLARVLEEDAAHARRASEIDLRFSGRAFLRFAEEGATARTSPSREGMDASGGTARSRGAVRTGPTG